MHAPLMGSSKPASLGTDAIRVGALGRVLGIWARPDDETQLSGVTALGRTGWREWFRGETFVESVDCSSRLVSTTMDGTG